MRKGNAWRMRSRWLMLARRLPSRALYWFVQLTVPMRRCWPWGVCPGGLCHRTMGGHPMYHLECDTRYIAAVAAAEGTNTPVRKLYQAAGFPTHRQFVIAKMWHCARTLHLVGKHPWIPGNWRTGVCPACTEPYPKYHESCREAVIARRPEPSTEMGDRLRCAAGDHVERLLLFDGPVRPCWVAICARCGEDIPEVQRGRGVMVRK